MTYSRGILGQTLILCLFLGWPAVVHGEPCQASKNPLQVECHFDGHEGVEFFHRSTELISDPPSTEVVVLDGTYYYATLGDLLGIRGPDARIVTRVRFPERIQSIEARPEGLVVALGDEDSRSTKGLVVALGDEDSRSTMMYRPGGPRPPGIPFARRGYLTWSAYEDALNFYSAGNHPENTWSDAVEFLTVRAEKDETNPFFWLLAGLAMEHQEADREAIDEAYRRATLTPGAHWMDLARSAVILELRGRSEDADVAERRARQAMAEVGVNPEEVYTLEFLRTLVFNTAAQWSDQGVDFFFHAALNDGDYETAHRGLQRLDELFPNITGRHLFYDEWARFLRDQRLEELADHWQRRVEEQREVNALEIVGDPAFIAGAFWGYFFVGFFIVGWILAVFLLAIRHGRRHREASWNVKEVYPAFGVLVPLLVAFLLAWVWWLDAPIYAQWEEASRVPSCVLDGRPACPSAVEYFEDSPVLQAMAITSLEALEEGRALPEATPTPEELRAIIDRRSEARRVLHVDGSLSIWLANVTGGALILFAVLLFLPVFGFGFVLGMIPGMGKWAALLIPGGSLSTRHISLVITCLFCAGLGGLAGAWSSVETHQAYRWLIRTQGFFLIEGYQNISHRLHFAWLVFAAMILHGVGVWLDHRRGEPESGEGP